MTTVTVSANYRVTIPKEIREALEIRPGQRLEVIQYDGRIELIPVPELSEARGSLTGMDTTIQREPDRLRTSLHVPPALRPEVIDSLSDARTLPTNCPLAIIDQE